jgi:hypothetical protein
MKFISLGGTCHETIALRECKKYAEAYPFDHIRCSFEGVIDCLQNNFQNFFPKTLKFDNFPGYRYNGRSIRGKYCGFFHHDVTKQEIRNDFQRRFKRMNNLLVTSKDNLVFIRATCTLDYQQELDLYINFEKMMKTKYPKINYILCFLIPEQKHNGFYKTLSNNTFVFTMHSSFLPHKHIQIYNEIEKLNLFKKKPPSNLNFPLIKKSISYHVDNIPVIDINN